MKTNRRNFVRNSFLFAGAAAVSPHASFAIHHSKKMTGAIVGHGDYKYHVDKNWGVQDASQIPIKNCHEMVEDANGDLFLLTDETKNNILIYDKSGRVKDTWTLNTPGAHGLTLSNEGEEQFLFVTDSEINKVYKTTMNGRVLLELGFPKESGVYENAAQWKPTEVAVAPNGDFYVADGYGNNYITQYSAKGEYIRHFGGKGDGEAQFDCCHGVTLDDRDANNPTLLITSRSKQEFKRFTLDGKYLETIQLPGCWICRPVIKGKNLYFAVIVTKSWWSYDGMVAVLNEKNEVVSLPGGSTPTYKDGKLEAPDYDEKSFLNPHDVCIDGDGNIYVPQWYSGKTYPVKLERV